MSREGSPDRRLLVGFVTPQQDLSMAGRASRTGTVSQESDNDYIVQPGSGRGLPGCI